MQRWSADINNRIRKTVSFVVNAFAMIMTYLRDGQPLTSHAVAKNVRGFGQFRKAVKNLRPPLTFLRSGSRRTSTSSGTETTITRLQLVEIQRNSTTHPPSRSWQRAGEWPNSRHSQNGYNQGFLITKRVMNESSVKRLPLVAADWTSKYLL